jgi:hypothetical protein
MYSFSVNSAIINQNKLYTADLWPGVRLTGRVDGMNADGELLEVKCRQNQLFARLPRRELCQLHGYMFLTNQRHCVMVQLFNNQLQTDVVQWDPKFWEALMLRLKTFANNHA